MKILLVTDLYPIFEDEKLIPKTIEDFVLGLKSLGDDVEVFRPNLIPNVLARGRKIQKSANYFHNGIKIYNRNYFFDFALNLNFLPNNFDIIVSHMPTGALFGAQVAKKLNLPHIHILHSSDITVLEDLKYHYFGKKIKNILNKLPALGARAPWIKQKVQNLFPDKEIFITPSGIKPQEINQEELLKKFEDDNFTITTVAQLIKRKNIDKLICAFAKTNQNCMLNIIGSGVCEKKLKIKNIHFLGQKTKNEVFEVLKKSQIFILPSKNETFGMAYLEALSFGCIAVCTNNSGLCGYIKNNQNGFLINPNREDIENILEKILKMDKNKLKEIAKNGLKIAQELNYKDCVENYQNNIKKFLH